MRRMLTLCFWIWALVGATLNFYQLIEAHLLSEIGAAKSTATIMDISFWAAGMILLGLGAAITPGEPIVVKAIAQDSELEHGWPELFRTFLVGIVVFALVTAALAVWIVVTIKPMFYFHWR